MASATKNEMQLNMNGMFICSDLSLLSFLILSFPVKHTETNESGRICFYYQQTPELLVAVEDFWNGKTLVEPKAYFNSIKIAKSRIFSNGGTVKWR